MGEDAQHSKFSRKGKFFGALRRSIIVAGKTRAICPREGIESPTSMLLMRRSRIYFYHRAGVAIHCRLHSVQKTCRTFGRACLDLRLRF